MYLLSYPLLLITATVALIMLPGAEADRYQSKFCDENGQPMFRDCRGGGDACPGNVTNDGNNCILSDATDCNDSEDSQCQDISWESGYVSKDAVCENGTYYTRHYTNPSCEGTVLKVPEGSGCHFCDSNDHCSSCTDDHPDDDDNGNCQGYYRPCHDDPGEHIFKENFSSCFYIGEQFYQEISTCANVSVLMGPGGSFDKCSVGFTAEGLNSFIAQLENTQGYTCTDAEKEDIDTAVALAVANTPDYSHVCKTPQSYTPTKITQFNNATCDEVMQYHTTGFKDSLLIVDGLALDFSSSFACADESAAIKNSVNEIAAECCGSAGLRDSACYVDYSHVCKTPASYTPTKMTPLGTCDYSMQFMSVQGRPLSGRDFSSAYTCASDTDTDLTKAVINYAAGFCCSGSGPPDSCTFDFSHVCKPPASYTPNSVYAYDDEDGNTVTSTCDAGMATSVYFGGLGHKNFSSPFACASESDEVKNIVNGIAAQCCGSAGLRDSSCHVDYSHICKTPATYTPTKITPYGNATCDQAMQYHTSSQDGAMLTGKDFSSVFSCANDTGTTKALINHFAELCCGYGPPPDSCALDFSHVCKSPASYTPKALREYEGDEGSVTATCDEIMARSVYFGGGLVNKSFSSAFTCADESDEVKNIVNSIATQCCGSGSAESQRSACHVDYSH
eukprot:g3014.t1